MAHMKIVLVDSDNAFISKLENPLRTAGFDCEKLITQKKVMDFMSQLTTDEFTGVMILGENLSEKLRSFLMEQCHDAAFSFPVLSVVQVDALDMIIERKVSTVMDYICTPLRSRELITRVGTLIRMAYPKMYEEQILRLGPYVFSRYPDRVSLRGRHLALTVKEYRLGRLFFEHIGKPLSRMTLSEAVWNSEEDESSRTIDTHVSRVRIKLGLDERNGFSLKQVYGFGYQLMAL